MKAFVTGHTCSIGEVICWKICDSGKFSELTRCSRGTCGDILSEQFSELKLPDNLDLVVHIPELGYEGLYRVWLKTREALSKNSGAFIFLSSTAALTDQTPYAISKRTQESYLREMATWSHHVRVNCIRLGHVSPSRHWPEGARIKTDQWLQRFVTPQEVADAVMFAVNCKSITGQILTVDSGITLKL